MLSGCIMQLLLMCLSPLPVCSSLDVSQNRMSSSMLYLQDSEARREHAVRIYSSTLHHMQR